ncbi:hypothetical protein BayCH28_01205 [Mycolicibacterium sp. CH28]|uniref:hypothetical protein n=1 Tax=Mycolicibacterium sp. CH28 TaxID=2512237 RepID=UPI0010803A64|nr:hypothetical protein [Mycolicibacterium sp. CH28]TGD90510.1 hypothetical protein BayCH28_01205 [Mycolicibacterium sp. CH28]
MIPGPTTSTTVTAQTARRKRLSQKPAAVVLGVLMLAVPLVPMILDAALPEREWSAAETASDQITAVTDEGNVVAVETPQGWEALDQGTSAVLRNDGVTVVVEAFDLDQRDPEAVTDRLIRLHRIQGFTSALDGGHVASPDGKLDGSTCVVVTESTTGTCAFVHDNDVIVSVISLGTPEQPAPPISQVIDLISKGQQ